MFGITSADVVYTLDLLFKKLLVEGLEYEELRPKYIMYVVNSVIADILLVNVYVNRDEKRHLTQNIALQVLPHMELEQMDARWPRFSLGRSYRIESGTLYALYISLDLAFRTNPSANIIFDSGLIQIVGIMPTLILVQISLGRASTIGTPSCALQEITGSSYWSEENRRTHATPADISLTDTMTRFSEGASAV
ncbi:hypothetical protein J132_08054 [Termitomyces sp. J132]|nr:hypothetical protein J132_08054 [Termitomyces sp. J132]